MLSATVSTAYVTYNTDGLFTFGGSLGFEKGEFKAKATIDGWVDGDRAANARGDGEFSVPGVSFKASGVVSSVGIAACRHGSGPDVGAGYKWATDDLTIFASSCDIGAYEAHQSRGARSAGLSEGLEVAPGEPVVVLAIRGDGGAPQVVLNGPNGERIAAPDGGRGIDRPDLMLVQYPDHQTTYMAIFGPAAGRWTATTAPGSVPIVEISRAHALPEPKVAATVVEQKGRAIVRWRLRPIPGQRVQFVERSANGARVIATTNAETGTAEFDALPDTVADRTVIAIVEQDGLTRREIEVGQFETEPIEVTIAPPPPGTGPPFVAPVPGAPLAGVPPTAKAGKPATPRRLKPARVARVRIERRPSGTVVASWPAARGAARYAVTVRYRGRRITFLQAQRRRILRGVRRSDGVRVAVTSVGRDGARSPARVAVRKGGRR